MTFVGTGDLSADGLLGLRSWWVDHEDAAGMEEDSLHGWRAGHLVVARESDEFNLQLLDGMIRQTLNRFDEIPGRDELLTLGVDPMRRPGDYGFEIVEGGSKAVLFQRHGTWCLYSKGSAAKADVDADNGFCRILARALAELRPTNVYLATFSRLVRNTEFAGQVMAACREHVRYLHVESQRLEPADERDRVLFNFFALFSDMERTAQRSRLLYGLMAKNDRGEFWNGKDAVPLGYVMTAGSRVVPDPRAEHVVQRLVRLLAEPGLTAVQIAAALGDLELATPHMTGAGWAYIPADGDEWGSQDADLASALAKARQRGRFVATMAHPKGQVRKWYDQLPLYSTGTWRKYHAVPPGMDRVGTRAAVKRPGSGMPSVVLELALGLPDGGWANEDVLAAALQRRMERSTRARGPQASPVLLPLLGAVHQWVSDGRLRQLRHSSRTGSADMYSVVSIDERRAAAMGPSRPGRPFDGWDRNGTFNGDIDARVEARELHRSLADAAVEALRDGVAARLLPSAPKWREHSPDVAGAAGPTEAERLAAAVVSHEKRAKARRRAYLAYVGQDGEPDEEYAEELRRDSESAALDLTRARGRLARAARETDGGAPDELEGPGELVLAVLGRIGRTPGAVPRRVAHAVCDVIRDIRIESTPLWADWSATLHLPADGGTIVVGPLNGRVRNRQRGPDDPAVQPARRHQGRARPEHDDETLGAVLAEGAAFADVLPFQGKHGRALRLRLARRLEQTYGMSAKAADALTTCPVLPTTKTVWLMANGADAADAARQAGVDPDFAAHLRTVYLDGAQPADRRWWAGADPRQDVVDLMMSRGGSVLRCASKQMFRDAGLRDTLITDLLQTSPAGLSLLHVVSSPGPVPAHDCRRRECAGDLLSLRPCPHCAGWATRIVRVPECPDGLLCPDCARMPSPGSPVLPEVYLTLDRTQAERLQERVAPDLALYRAKRVARDLRHREGAAPPPRHAPAEPVEGEAAVREWAAANGIRIKQSRKLPAWIVGRYHEAQAGRTLPASGYVPQARTPQAVRSWRASIGRPLSEQGRIPAAAYREYDQAQQQARAQARPPAPWDAAPQ